MRHIWQFHEAKKRFNEVVDEALHKGVQIIGWRGSRIAVILSYDEYTRLMQERARSSDVHRVPSLMGLDLLIERN